MMMMKKKKYKMKRERDRKNEIMSSETIHNSNNIILN